MSQIWKCPSRIFIALFCICFYTIAPAQELQVDKPQQFGPIELGAKECRSFTITNPSITEKLSIQSLTLDQSLNGFEISGKQAPFVLDPGTSESYEICFLPVDQTTYPNKSGYYPNRMRIYYTAGTNSTLLYAESVLTGLLTRELRDLYEQDSSVGTPCISAFVSYPQTLPGGEVIDSVWLKNLSDKDMTVKLKEGQGQWNMFSLVGPTEFTIAPQQQIAYAFKFTANYQIPERAGFGGYGFGVMVELELDNASCKGFHYGIGGVELIPSELQQSYYSWLLPLFPSGTTTVSLPGKDENILHVLRFFNNRPNDVKVISYGMENGKNFRISESQTYKSSPTGMILKPQLNYIDPYEFLWIYIEFTPDGQPSYSDNLVITTENAITSQKFGITQGAVHSLVEGNKPLPNLRLQPNPTSGQTMLSADHVHNGSVTVTDARGVQLYQTTFVDGKWLWDGKSSDGLVMPAGAYFVQLSGISEDGSAFSETLTLIKY